MTRRGKIARLPKEIRDELNGRLQDGEPMEPLAEWLNGLPEVTSAMGQYFKGDPVNRHNISEWKAGGFAVFEGSNIDEIPIVVGFFPLQRFFRKLRFV